MPTPTYHQCAFPKSNANTQATLACLHTSALERTRQYSCMLALACAVVLWTHLPKQAVTYIHASKECG